jgi:hypothetical protein
MTISLTIRLRAQKWKSHTNGVEEESFEIILILEERENEVKHFHKIWMCEIRGASKIKLK